MIYSYLRAFLLLCAIPFTVAAEAPKERPTVLVSIAPYRYFVERLAGEHVEIEVLVPPGASSHTYEPRPKQVIAISKAAVWFRLGEASEKKTLDALRSHSPNIQLVDLRDGVNLIEATPHSHHHTEHGHHCCHADGFDPHIWLSARTTPAQAQAIAETLTSLIPEQASTIAANLQDLLQDLSEVDRELTQLFEQHPNRTIVAAHPAYAYLCRDYGITQLGIEYEGREPTPRQMSGIIEEARALGIDTIYVQQQHNRKGAEVVAKALGAEIVELDPFSEDYLNNLRAIGHAFAGQ